MCTQLMHIDKIQHRIKM